MSVSVMQCDPGCWGCQGMPGDARGWQGMAGDVVDVVEVQPGDRLRPQVLDRPGRGIVLHHRILRLEGPADGLSKLLVSNSIMHF